MLELIVTKEQKSGTLIHGVQDVQNIKRFERKQRDIPSVIENVKEKYFVAKSQNYQFENYLCKNEKEIVNVNVCRKILESVDSTLAHDAKNLFFIF